MSEYLEIVIQADVQTKKNNYGQTKSGKRYKPTHIVETEKLALQQIPAEYFGMDLKHPGVEVFMEMPKKSWAMDQDGAWTTVLDYLVKAGVVHDDNIRSFNGPKYLHPVVEAERKKITITLMVATMPNSFITWLFTSRNVAKPTAVFALVRKVALPTFEMVRINARA